MNKLAITLLLLFVSTGAVQAAGDAASGQAKSALCAACHNADGNSVNPIWPKLAGQHASYIEKQLAAFKAGSRTNETMSPMALPLSEQDMADLAAYFSSQSVTINSADAEKAALGEKIYRGGVGAKGVAACMSCHGPSGAGNPGANFPSLSGQHGPYVAKALRDFKSGVRTNDPAGMMRGVVAAMSDNEIDAVAEYISGLH